MRAILVLACLSFATCAHAQAWDPRAAPVHQVLTTPRIRTGHDVPLLSAGVVTFVGGFLGTAVGTSYWYSQDNACMSDALWISSLCTHHQLGDTSLAFAFVPIVGPWIMLSDPYLSGASYLWPVAAGLVQDVGFVLMLIGLIDTREVEVPPRLNVRPSVGASSVGIVAEGVF